MKKVSIDDIESFHHEGSEGVDFRALLAQNVKAPNFYLRILDIAPGGHTPHHSHHWEHGTFVAKGRGKVVLTDREERIREGDAVLVEPDEKHMFVNDSKSLLRVVCVIPKPESDR